STNRWVLPETLEKYTSEAMRAPLRGRRACPRPSAGRAGRRRVGKDVWAGRIGRRRVAVGRDGGAADGDVGGPRRVGRQGAGRRPRRAARVGPDARTPSAATPWRAPGAR